MIRHLTLFGWLLMFIAIMAIYAASTVAGWPGWAPYVLSGAFGTLMSAAGINLLPPFHRR